MKVFSCARNGFAVSRSKRYRRRILRAAQEVFAAHGLGAGLNDIARHAGVGGGTVQVRRYVEDLLQRAQQEGSVRPSVTAEDFTMM